PEVRIAKAEKRFGAHTNIGNLYPIVAVQKRNIPLNGRCKIGIISGLSASQGTVGNLQIDPRVLCHLPKKMRHVLNRVGTNDESPVSGFRHVLSGNVERLAHIIYIVRIKGTESQAVGHSNIPATAGAAAAKGSKSPVGT